MAAINECLHCNKPVYESNPIESDVQSKLKKNFKNFIDEIVVTQCGHVFDRHCLALSFLKSPTCPSCREVTSLEKCKILSKVMKDFSDHYAQSYVDKALKDTADKTCSICLEEFSSAYFIPESNRFVHKDCWEKLPSRPLKFCELYPQQIATAERLRSPAPNNEDANHAGVVAFFAILPLMSLWALAMNWRFYKNRNPWLFVLSIPALLIYKTASLLFTVLRKILFEKPA